MPLSGRHYANPDDLLDSTTDTFLRWASEFDLIEMQVDEQGEVFFTPTGCEHDQEDAQPAPLPRKRPARRRLAMVAIPVMASMALAGTARAAYILASPEVTYVAQSGERIHFRGGFAQVEHAPLTVADAAPKANVAPKAVPTPAAPLRIVEVKAPGRSAATPSLGAKSKREQVTGKALPAATKAAAPEAPPILGVPGVIKPTTAPVKPKEPDVTVGLPGGISVTLAPDTVSANSLPRPLPNEAVVPVPPVDSDPLVPVSAVSAVVEAR